MTKCLRQRPTDRGPNWLRQSIGATILALGCLLALSGCSAADPLPTVVPTVQPAVLTPIVAPTLPPTPPPTPRPSATPAPSPTPCQFPLQPALADAWSADELGCPITSGAAAINTAYAPFEGGQMLWRGDTDNIYVLFNDGRWASYRNTWREDDPEYTCGAVSYTHLDVYKRQIYNISCRTLTTYSMKSYSSGTAAKRQQIFGSMG